MRGYKFFLEIMPYQRVLLCWRLSLCLFSACSKFQWKNLMGLKTIGNWNPMKLEHAPVWMIFFQKNFSKNHQFHWKNFSRVRPEDLFTTGKYSALFYIMNTNHNKLWKLTKIYYKPWYIKHSDDCMWNNGYNIELKVDILLLHSSTRKESNCQVIKKNLDKKTHHW